MGLFCSAAGRGQHTAAEAARSSWNPGSLGARLAMHQFPVRKLES